MRFGKLHFGSIHDRRHDIQARCHHRPWQGSQTQEKTLEEIQRRKIELLIVPTDKAI